MHDSTIALTRVLRTPSLARRCPRLPSGRTPGDRACPDLRGHASPSASFALDDGAALLPLITAPEVTRFMSPPPEMPNWFAAFIAATARERQAGRYAGFAIVPHGQDHAVGLVQIRQLEPGFSTAEWGIALGSAVVGQGAVFEDTGRLILAVCLRDARRAPPRSAGGHAERARQRRGAQARRDRRRACCAARSARPMAQHHDQILWAWLGDEWRRDEARAPRRGARMGALMRLARLGAPASPATLLHAACCSRGPRWRPAAAVAARRHPGDARRTARRLARDRALDRHRPTSPRRSARIAATPDSDSRWSTATSPKCRTTSLDALAADPSVSRACTWTGRSVRCLTPGAATAPQRPGRVRTSALRLHRRRRGRRRHRLRPHRLARRSGARRRGPRARRSARGGLRGLHEHDRSRSPTATATARTSPASSPDRGTTATASTRAWRRVRTCWC